MPSDNNLGHIPILSDPEVEQIDCGQAPIPDQWHSRRLYIRQQGARNWCNVVQQSSYPLHGEDPYDLIQNRAAAISRAASASMVSLGPGDAAHDVEIVSQLRRHNPEFKYIPVDLSRFLLDTAIRNMASQVHIPAGLQCDFEHIPDAVKHTLEELARPPVLFSMLGGTVGNLDLGEKRFFSRMQNLMVNGDHFLIDVPLAGPGWAAERDPRFQKETYTAEFNQFIGFGLSGIAPGFNGPIAPEALLSRIDCRLGNGGDIANTRTVTIFDRPTRQVILKFCRYDWESVVSWFQNQGFQVLFHRCSLKADADVFGMGIILLGLSTR